MRTSSSADATSDFAVRESHAAGMKMIPRMTPNLRSLGDSVCGDGELHLYSVLGGSVQIVASSQSATPRGLDGRGTWCLLAKVDGGMDAPHADGEK